MTLRQMREAAGLSTRAAAVLLAEVLHEESRTHASIIKIENEGTNLDDVIEAMAKVYMCDPTMVRIAARSLREQRRSLV